MAQILTNTIFENPQTKPYLNNPGAEVGNVKDLKNFNNSGPTCVREPDIAELHALFEIDYEQFLIDTSDEIAKRAQRLLELESIVFGAPSSG